MTITVKLKKGASRSVIYDISRLVTSIGWSGSASEASRSLDLSVVQNPFDKELISPEIETGDIVYFYTDSVLRLVGRVVSKSKTSSPGDVTVKVFDFMNLLLKSKVSYVFKNTTPEKIARRVLTDIGIPVGKLKRTGVVIKKWIVDEESAYNVIIGAYYRAYKKTKVKYMPIMDGVKFCIVEKGTDSGATLRLDANVTESSVDESAEDIVNRIVIFDDKGKKIGVVQDKDSIRLFGISQEIYKKEDGVAVKEGARALLQSPTREAKISALGNIDCTAGKSVTVQDTVTGLIGKFWIEDDSHSFSGGTHTMSLTLSFQNLMEGAEADGAKPIATGDSVCFYSTGGDKFHSARKCGTGLVAPIKSTVNEAVKAGKQKCSRCWR